MRAQPGVLHLENVAYCTKNAYRKDVTTASDASILDGELDDSRARCGFDGEVARKGGSNRL
jgi:hypothetical protein